MRRFQLQLQHSRRTKLGSPCCLLKYGSTDPVCCMFHILSLNYVCFNNFFVSLHTLHPFPSNVFSFRCKVGAFIRFTIGGSTGHTLWPHRPRDQGHLNRAVRRKLGLSHSDNKSDISCFKIYIFMHYSNVCLYAKTELNLSKN